MKTDIRTTYRHHVLLALATVATLALQGCRKDSHPSDPTPEPEPDYAIGLAAPSVAGTRALIESDADLTAFGVYGYKQGPVSQMVFAGQMVEKNVADNTWGYTPVKYWDRTASYSFAAYASVVAPNGFTYEHDEATRTLTITAPQWQTINGGETDLLVATSQAPANDYLNRHGGQVKLTFEHLYAQLEVQVWVADFIDNTYMIKSVTCSDANIPEDNTTGTYTLDYDASPATASYALTAATDGALLYTSETGLQANKQLPDATTTEATFKHMVLPFTSSDQTNGFTITLNYTIGTETPVDYTATVHSTLKQMKAGQRYVLSLTFSSGNNITPDVSIAEWIPEDVEEDDKHNW